MAALASTEDYELYTGTDSSDRVGALLDAASAKVRRYIGQDLTFVEGDVVTVYPRNGAARLPQRPVIDVTDVSRNGTTLDPAGYRWNRQGLIVGPDNLNRIDMDLVWGTTPLVVTYSHGYEEIPADVVEVVVNIARRKLTASGGEVTQESETIGGYTHSLSYGSGSDLFDDEKATLDAYRIPLGTIDVYPAWA